MVGDQEHPSLRQPVDAVRLGAEPVAVKDRVRQVGPLRDGRAETEGVVAVCVQVDRNAAEMLLDLLIERGEWLGERVRRPLIETGCGLQQRFSAEHWRRCPGARIAAGTRSRYGSDDRRACTGT